MSNQFHFELASPERLIINKPVASVVVPGKEGAYGVLAQHAPMITAMQPGVVEVYEQDDQTITDRVFVSGGFAEVTGTRCTVLAENAEYVSELDRARVEAEVKALYEEIANCQEEEESEELKSRMAVAQAKLQAIGE